MTFNIEIDVSVMQIVCLGLLVWYAWNPGGMFKGYIEAMGYKVPTMMLAWGAGFRSTKKAFGNITRFMEGPK